MTKRIISLVLGLLMILAVLTSCGGEEDAVDATIDEASRYTTTLNVWVITESEAIEKASELIYGGFNAESDYEGFAELEEEKRESFLEDLDEEKREEFEENYAIYEALSKTEQAAVTQLGAINKAINKITKTKYKTQLKFRYLTEKNYYTALEKAYADREAAKKNGTLELPAITSDETVLNEYGIPELKYPTTPEYQVDILYVGNAQKYREYADKEWLASMDGMLEDSAVQLTYYINGVLLNSCKYNGVTWGIPTNATIGEYLYFAVDEQLANSYYYDPEDFEIGPDGVTKSYEFIYGNACKDFLDKVYQLGNVTPIYCEQGVSLDELAMVHYWNFDLDSVPGDCLVNPSAFSLFGGFYTRESTQGYKVGYSNLLKSTSYGNTIKTKIHYQSTPGYLTDDATQKTAVRIERGDLQTRAELEAAGYRVLVVDPPRATDEEVFGNMFCISDTTQDPVRCMELLTFLNTTSELRNLLQYGIENVNYTLKTWTDAEGNTYKYAEMTEENVYEMDVKKTGNIFMAYPDSAEHVLDWENGKKQNRDAISYPTVGMYFDLQTYKLDEKSVRVINAVSAKLDTLINDMTTEAEVEAFWAAARQKLNNRTLAEFLLEEIGENVTYQMGGKTLTVTESDLISALGVMSEDVVIETEKEENTIPQSPFALYNAWLELILDTGF